MPSREAVINPQPSPSEITVFAPAKINLILRILDRRPDGFHNLWSVMQTIALDDEVQVTARACPLFVPFVEEGWLDHPAIDLVARDYLGPLDRKSVV